METYDFAAKAWMAGVSIIIVVFFLATYIGIKRQEAAEKKEAAEAKSE